jgi:hypothetical protein
MFDACELRTCAAHVHAHVCHMCILNGWLKIGLYILRKPLYFKRTYMLMMTPLHDMCSIEHPMRLQAVTAILESQSLTLERAHV